MKSAVAEVCTIKIANFEGPFDLLFHLIEKNKIDIYDIPISEITDQYMEYLFDMQQFNLEIASEFLVMAATLLHIKSALLLPSKKESDVEEEIDPRDELVERLLQYKKYKAIAETFKDREKQWEGFFYKSSEKITIEKQYKPIDITVYELAFLFKDMLVRKNNKIQKQKTIEQLIKPEKVTVKQKIKQVLNFLKTKTIFKFSEIFNFATQTKEEIVTGFLAILELAKIKKVLVSQQTHFDDITIKRVGKVSELNALAFDQAAATADNIESYS